MLLATLQTSPGVLRAAVFTTAPRALVASDVAGRMFSSRALNVNQTQRSAPVRQPPAERERIREKLRKKHEQAVAQLRELERRSKLHKPVVDIPAPHIGEHQDVENALHHVMSTGDAALAESREVQSRTKKSTPLVLSLSQQWKRALG